MASVTIGLNNPELLKWFNEFHAALLRADKAIKEHPDDKRSHLSQLIATVKVIELQMDNSFAAAKVKPIPHSTTGTYGSAFDLLGRVNPVEAEIRRERESRRHTGG